MHANDHPVADAPGRGTQRAIKRGFDIAAAGLGLLLLSPLLACIALAVRLDSPGPILFRQNRLGRNGGIFNIYKFRTMADGAVAKGTGLRTFEGDPRVTRTGKTLRTLHLDELPQLANVLKGEMSLVGPRPVLPFQYDYYTEREKMRTLVAPGITGLAQTSGATLLSWDERLELDAKYVETWSLAADARILATTALIVLRRIFRSEAVQKAAHEPSWTRGLPENLYTNSRIDSSKPERMRNED